MKKLLIAILALVYIGTSTGVTLHMHYCMEKLAGWEFGHNNSNTCSQCGMEKSEEKDNGCCRDEHKFIKNDADQKTAEVTFHLLLLQVVALPVSFIEIPFKDFASLTEQNPISHAPPQPCSIAVYIRNCVFLI